MEDASRQGTASVFCARARWVRVHFHDVRVHFHDDPFLEPLEYFWNLDDHRRLETLPAGEEADWVFVKHKSAPSLEPDVAYYNSSLDLSSWLRPVADSSKVCAAWRHNFSEALRTAAVEEATLRARARPRLQPAEVAQ
ncbi:unnamed protein product, partial [Polarella glacialis]